MQKLYGVMLCVLVIVGAGWMVENAGYVPAYGDTTEYLALSRTLKVDQYRTIFYPMFLRLSGVLHNSGDVPSPIRTYLIQVLVVAISSIAYAAAIMKEFTALKFSRVKAAALVLLVAAVTVNNPLVAHFSLSLMSDSLASSLTVTTVAVLSRVCSSDTSPGCQRIWLAIGACCLLLMAISRVDKLYLGLLLLATVAIVLAMRCSRCGAPKILGVTLYLGAALVVAGGVNRVTQITSHDRPPLDLSSMAFNRVVWSRLSEVYPYLSPDAKSLITIEDAKRFDTHNNNVYPLLGRLLDGHPENKKIINEITLITLRKFPLQVAGKTCFDIVKYMLPNLAFPLELVNVLPQSTATEWTYSRMSEPHPVETKVWMVASTGIFLFFQIPFAFLFLKRARMFSFFKSPIVLLSASCVLGNALMFGLEAGMDAHIRYALPAYVMLFEMVVFLSILKVVARQRKPKGLVAANDRS